MDSKTILEFEWNEKQFGIRSGMDSKTILEFERNQRQFWNQEWDGFKDHFGIGIESILQLSGTC